MRLLNLLVLITIIAIMFTGQAAYQSDLDNNKTRDIYNLTETSLIWDSSVGDNFKDSFRSNINVMEYDVNVKRFGNVLGEFVNFIGYSSMELGKWSIEYGYTHPEHDLGFFLDFLIKILWLLVIMALIPLVVPVVALVYLFFKGIYLLIIKIKNWVLKDEPKEES